MNVKQLPLYLLMIPLMFTLVAAPAVVSAKHGNDDDQYEDRDDDDRDEDEDEDEDDDRSDDSLEIEADIFTDTTIVKVEINDKKTIFATDADTREDVIDAIVAKFDLSEAEVDCGIDFDLSEAEVDAALELETEDRASRPQDRGKLNREIKREKHDDKIKKWWGNHSSTTPKVCRDDDTALQIEADVFTDKTVVKVEFVNAKDEVFTTSATTSADIVNAVAGRYSTLSTSSIQSALDIDIEDRASRPTDLMVDSECKDGVKATSTPSVTTEAKLAELRARIVELQTMLDRLISLLRGN
jgi:hypothetical protein